MISTYFWLLFVLLLFIDSTQSGHEVLFNIKPDNVKVLPHEIALIQFDSRPLANYWNTTAVWNQHYARQYGHQYYFLSKRDQVCENEGSKLAMPWCKVHAMLKAHEMTSKETKMIVFMDSDVLLTVNHSMSVILTYIQQDLQWNWEEKPVAFNQDGPGFACKQAYSVGYSPCFNSGVVIWRKSSLAYEILSKWWESGKASLGSNRFPMNWKVKWPWEQAQQYEIYRLYPYSIQVLSFPKLLHLPWTSTKQPKAQYPSDAIEPWCFTHWPGANCFLTHFCASKRQKEKMRLQYQTLMQQADSIPFTPVKVHKYIDDDSGD